MAEDLSYLHVGEDGVRLKDATDLAGETTYGTCEAVRDREGRGYNTHVIAAGPAGENGVRFACLLHNCSIRPSGMVRGTGLSAGRPVSGKWGSLRSARPPGAS